MEISKDSDSVSEKGTNKEAPFKKESIFQRAFRFVIRWTVYIIIIYYVGYWVINLLYQPVKFLYEIINH